jgi:REP element-mobilizing transposase RayT
MGRQTRKLSSTGFYHVVFRGINRQHVFEDSTNSLEHWVEKIG